MAVLSTFTVAGIVATALGLGVVGIMKWPLGISESISVVILIGFSMDYVIHLAGTLNLQNAQRKRATCACSQLMAVDSARLDSNMKGRKSLGDKLVLTCVLQMRM